MEVTRCGNYPRTFESGHDPLALHAVKYLGNTRFVGWAKGRYFQRGHTTTWIVQQCVKSLLTAVEIVLFDRYAGYPADDRECELLVSSLSYHTLAIV